MMGYCNGTNYTYIVRALLGTVSADNLIEAARLMQEEGEDLFVEIGLNKNGNHSVYLWFSTDKAIPWDKIVNLKKNLIESQVDWLIDPDDYYYDGGDEDE